VALVIRRIVSAAAGAVVLTAGGGLAATSAVAATGHQARHHAVDYTPKTPSSHVPGTEVKGLKATRYCVSGYKPHSVVVINNSGHITRVMANASGNACTSVPVHKNCNSIVATGVGANGQSATSSAPVCVLGEQVSRSVLPFTGSDVIVPGTEIGAGLAAVGGLLLLAARRRRRATAAV
jgi:hypothetical protein